MLNITNLQEVLNKNKYVAIDTYTPYAKVFLKEYENSYHAILCVDNTSCFLKSSNNVKLLKELVLSKLQVAFYDKPIEMLFVMQTGVSSYYYNISLMDDAVVITSKGKCIVRGDIKKCFDVEMGYIKDVQSIGKNMDKIERLENKPIREYGVAGTILLIMLTVYISVVSYLNGNDLSISVQETLINKRLHTLITYMFAHGNILHLVGNCFTLFLIGRNVENVFGAVKTYIVYILGGIYAGFGSCLYKLATGNMYGTVGASGSIFALLGCYSVLAVYLSEDKLKAIKKVLLYTILTIGTGMTNPMTDNACHISGYIAGIIITIVIMGIEQIYTNIRVFRMTKNIMNKERKYSGTRRI